MMVNVIMDVHPLNGILQIVLIKKNGLPVVAHTAKMGGHGDMLLRTLQKQNLIQPPPWLIDNCMYLTIMGSEAYGVSSGASDVDLYGFTIPPKPLIFPHLQGEIFGFGRQLKRFDQWQQNHIQFNKRSYDFQVYSIVRYFHLCMENNPNMIDSLFTPRRCVLHSSQIWEHIRDNRKLFLHKGAWHKFKGYAYAQLAKIRQKSNSSNPKRQETIQQFGYDVKFAYHLVRLLNECEQILIEGDLDLERNREQLKDIRRGAWSLEDVEAYFVSKEKSLEELYLKSELPHSPDEEKIKRILVDCLEMHYGSLTDAIYVPTNAEEILSGFEELTKKYRLRVAQMEER